MYNLQRTIKTVEELLKTPKDILAMELLRELAKSRQGEYFNRNGLHQIADAYPVDRRAEVEDAVMEAFSILDESHFFKRAREGKNADRGFMMFTLKGEEMLHANEEKLLEWQRSAEFSRRLLHPKIVDVAWGEYVRGKRSNAIFLAFKALEIAVRQTAGLPSSTLGKVLMRNAFAPENPPLSPERGRLTDFTIKDSNARQGVANLFDGAYAVYRNINAHDDDLYTVEEAREILMLASHLLRIVDKAAARLS